MNVHAEAASATFQPRRLKRALGLWMLVFYGLGTIVGAGIYILVGEVARDAGMAMPLAFAGAGLLAVFTGLSYAELAARFPEAAGASAYVAEGLGSPVAARVTGLLVLLTGLIIAASLARGGAAYITGFVDLPAPVIAGALVIFFTGIACLNVRKSVGLTAALTVVELLGLALVLVAGAPSLTELPERAHEILPDSAAKWSGVSVGVFVAFFAYIGFESLANIAEEAKYPRRDLPRAIILSIIISSAIYVSVALIVVLTVPMDELVSANAPLSLVMVKSGWGSPELLTIIALIAIPNGLLADLLMTSRLLYGMARRKIAPAWLTNLTSRSQVPVIATIAVGAGTLMFSTVLPFSELVTATSALSLFIFLMVNLSLWRLQRKQDDYVGFKVPGWMSPVGAALCAALLLAEIAKWVL